MLTISRKEHIKTSAQKLFRQKGYAATSMRNLAKEVGMEAPSIYNHFNSKQALLKDICFDMAEQFFTALNEALQNSETHTQKLSNVIKAHIKVIYTNIEASTVFFNEWIFLEGDDLVQFKRLRNAYEQKFNEIIKAGIAAKVFKSIDATLLTFTILASLNATYNLQKRNKKISADTMATHITHVLLSGILSQNINKK